MSNRDDDFHQSKPASAAALDGYRRLALGVVVEAIRDLHDPDPYTATDALCFVLDDTCLGMTGFLDAVSDLGASDPVVVLGRCIHDGKKQLKKTAGQTG